MFLQAKLRRSIIMFLVMVATVLGLFLIIFPAPDLSQEMELLRRISELSLRIRHAENLNLERKVELEQLFHQFSIATQIILDKKSSESSMKRHMVDEILETSGSALRKYGLGVEGEALLKGFNWTYDLSLPGVHHFLPHVANNPKSLVPAFKMAAAPQRHQVSMVLGIPTVKRDHQSYLQVTLKSIMENLSPEERDDCLIIVFVAETEPEFVASVASDIQRTFPEQVSEGLLEVISPPASYYPDFSRLRQTLGDEPDRVQWRSKQNLDYAFLMMYAHWRGHFYVQLEDDVLTKAGFFTSMKEYALERESHQERWFVIDYCQLGFIGKLFKSSDLPTLVQFFLMFYNDKPVDWLLENIIQTMVCKLDQDLKSCKKEKAALWVHFKPSLFQHIGTHSSLKGKVQKLKDKQFGKIPLFVPHQNPPAKIETVIKHYKAYSLTRAYNGETFYWGLVPQAGDTITFQLSPPVPLTGFKFVSGNAEHPSDRFLDTTTVSIHISENENSLIPGDFRRTEDNFAVVGKFEEDGIAQADLDPDWGPVSSLRIGIHDSSDNWAILSEIHIKTV